MYLTGCWLPLLSIVTLYALLSSCNVDNEQDMVLRRVTVDARQESQLLRISNKWQLLGPFQIGTREGSWGADPLEYHGGFRNLQYDPDATFRTSLPVNGTAKWSEISAKQSTVTSNSTNVSLSIGYDNVDWDFLKVVYGWAAVQYQTWARGELFVGGNKTQHVILYTDAIIEFWVDDVHYFGGDAYTFRKAPPMLHLEPGAHRIDLRLWRDVRAFGGINEPTIDVVLEARVTTAALELATPGILLSDVVDGNLASPLASVTVRNNGEDDLEITNIRPLDTNTTLNNNNTRITIVAGQTRPLTFNIALSGSHVSSVHFEISYRATRSDNSSRSLKVSQSLTRQSLYDPHKITFPHPGGIVSYAMLRPPAKNVTCKNASLPVLVVNHGAGVEASNPDWTHALNPVSDLCAWVLFPTGVTPWSGDDWHNWGFADVEAAVFSIPSWIENVGWTGPDVNIERWIMTGHSNGGQGTWYGLTHRPDRLVAAAPLSGYSSIQKYVPYELWQPADPRKTAVISASLNSYRHEMLLENIKGIDVLQQHGEIDDNVPTYHSRFLGQQLTQGNGNSTYYEAAGENHVWDTMMTTKDLTEFYYKQTTSNVKIPRKVEDFSIVVGDPGDMGPKGGIRVTHLEDPGQYGRVDVRGHVITTSNVWGLEINLEVFPSASISIDAKELSFTGGTTSITKTEDGEWTVGTNQNRTGNGLLRTGRQLGSMTAILRTRGPFLIRHHDVASSRVALQISRNLHQYFYADASIERADTVHSSERGNVITVIAGQDIPSSLYADFPIQVSPSAVIVKDSKGRRHKYGTQSRTSAIYLRPLQDERLELVVWGSDAEALSQAARLVPMMTGVGQPDFVVLGESALWRGVEGAVALGFFDYRWEVTASSVVS